MDRSITYELSRATVAAPGGSANGFVSALCARHLLQVVGNTATFRASRAPSSLAGRHVRCGAARYGSGGQLIAKYGKGQPAQIKQRLLNGVDDLGAPGKDPFYGAGRVNVAKALSQ